MNTVDQAQRTVATLLSGADLMDTSLFSLRAYSGGCAYQKVDPLTNWQLPTGTIRLAVGRR